MSVNFNLITIGPDKNGDMDFGVNGSITAISLEQMQQLRQMLFVAAYVAEDMWRREQERRNPVQTERKEPK